MAELIDVGGHRLLVEVSGRDDAPWIVLSHGLGLTMSMWEPQLPLLEQHRRVLRYDTRGLGASDVPTGPYKLSGLAGDIVALMDRFGIERADVMGLSLGGRTAMGVGLDHPDRVNRLIVADTRADAPAGYKASWDKRISKVKSDGLAAMWPELVGGWFTRDSIENKADLLARAKREYAATPLDGYLACAEAIKETDYLKRLGSLGVPTLFIGGSEDPGGPPGVMREMAEATPGAKHVVLPDASHLSNIDNPDAFNAEVAAFLGLDRD